MPDRISAKSQKHGTLECGTLKHTCRGVALFSGLQSGLITIPFNPSLEAGKAQTRTFKQVSRQCTN